MENNISVVQAKNLIKLGIDLKTSDMYWDTNYDKIIDFPIHNWGEDIDYENMINNGLIPSWTLTALLGLLQNYTLTTVIPYWDKDKKIDSKDNSIDSYTDQDTIDLTVHSIEKNIIKYGETPLDAAYKAVCWFLEHGYKLPLEKIDFS